MRIDNIFNEMTEEIKTTFEVFISFNVGYHPNGVCYKHNAMDIRQFHAINLGFMLTKDEMSMDFFPNKVILPVEKSFFGKLVLGFELMPTAI